MLCYAIMVHSSHCIEVRNSLSRCFDNWLEFHPLCDSWLYLIPRESVVPGYLSDFMDIFDFDIFCISCVYIIGGKKNPWNRIIFRDGFTIRAVHPLTGYFFDPDFFYAAGRPVNVGLEFPCARYNNFSLPDIYYGRC